MNTVNTSAEFQNTNLNISDLIELMRLAWRPAAIGGLFIGLIAFGGSHLIQPVYRAQVVLEFVGDPTKQGSPQRGAGELSSIAAIAGINLGSDGSRREAALATLKSRAFARDFISRHNLLIELNHDIWDAATQQWSEEPSTWRTVERFREQVVRVTEDPKTALITIWIEWDDPEVAANWATQLVEQINQRLKEIAIEETNRSLDHLKAELESTQNTELQRVIARLTESQIEALMFADIRDEFAFRTIDSAVTPPLDEYVYPNHLVFLVLGVFLGVIVGAFAAVLHALIKVRMQAKRA